MERLKFLFVGLGVVVTLILSGCAGQTASAQITGRVPSSNSSQSFVASIVLARQSDKQGPDKGPKGDDGKTGNKGNNGKNGKQDNRDGNAGGEGKAKNQPAPGQGNASQAGAPTPSGRGFAAWLQTFRARLSGRATGLAQGGWQLGRFKDAFPFAYPPGWAARERGEALLLTGSWQGNKYVFQMTRSVRVGARSLEDWVASDLQQLGVASSNVRYDQARDVRVAVVSGIHDSDYACPVAYVYLWTSNPAGRNQRQALGVVSQAPGSACNPTALNAFVDAYLVQVGGNGRGATLPEATATQAPSVTATPGNPNATWQHTRFFNAFSFGYPGGWSMDRLGDTAHLQGTYQGRGYVADMVWVRDAPQVGLEQWARADLGDLGVNTEGVRIDYTSQGNDAQVAVVGGVRMRGYTCPVIRMYVLANNAAGGGKRSYTATVAQANGQECNLQALEDLAYLMLQQAQ